jgi:iron complex transport system ATP-binding protein
VGKSTLVKCINGLLKPSTGSVEIDGTPVSSMSKEDIADRISYVPAVGMDYFSMTVIDSILVGRHNKQKWKTTDEDLRIVYNAMDLMGITDLAMHGSNELSAGQHQKVALARGIVHDADIMILDEPTANLDVRHQVYVTQLLRAFADIEGKLVIMICHDLNIASRYASSIVVMAPPGKIHSVGRAEEVMNRDTIRQVYDIDCDILEYEGKPLVILKSTFGADDSLIDL